MRFHFNDSRRHRQVAKALVRELRSEGIPIGHTAALDLAARLYGYTDAHELEACLGKGPGSLWDEDEAPGIVAARLERHVGVLQGIGVRAEQVEGILSRIAPTRRQTGKAPLPKASRVPPEALATDARRGRPAVDIDDIIDSWGHALDHAPMAGFERLVRELYDCGYDGCEVMLYTKANETVFGTLDRESTVIGRSPASSGMLEWLQRVGEGRSPNVMHVRHADMEIPVVIHLSVAKDFVSGRFRLLRTKAGSKPYLQDSGVAQWEAWGAALMGRTGLHLLVSPEPAIDLMEIVDRQASAYGIRGTFHHSPKDAHAELYRRSGQVDALPTTLVRDTLLSAPSEILMFDLKSPDWEVIEVAMRAISDRRSVVLVTRDGEVEDLVRGILHAGMPPAFMRSCLVATGERLPDEGGKPSWTVDVRKIPFAGSPMGNGHAMLHAGKAA